jgi:hypothetical protein
MNTKITIVFFTLLFLNLNAQKNSFGTRLGISSMYVSESQGKLKGDYDSRVGFNAALFVELGIGKYFSFQPELNFTNKGYKFNQGQSINIKFNYLEIPVILKPKIPVGDALELYGEFGPSFSLGLGGEAVINNQTYGDLFGDGAYNSFDFGLNYGGGFNVKLNSGYKFGLGIRFFKGLSELYPTNPGNVAGRNNGFILGLNLSKSID